MGRGRATSITVLSSGLPSSGEMNFICFVRSPMPTTSSEVTSLEPLSWGPNVLETAGAEVAVAMGFADPRGSGLKGVQVEMKRKVVERLSCEVVIGESLGGIHLMFVRDVGGVNLIGYDTLRQRPRDFRGERTLPLHRRRTEEHGSDGEDQLSGLHLASPAHSKVALAH